MLNLPLSLFAATGALVGTYLVLFLVASLRERRRRAQLASLLSLIVTGGLWYGWYLFAGDNPVWLSLPSVGLALFLVLFFAPLGRSRVVDAAQVATRVDERDVMFTREEYKPGTSRYHDYYDAHPEFKESDDRLRELPELLKPGGRYYDPVQSKAISAVFRKSAALITAVDGEVSAEKTVSDPAAASADIKKQLLELGADEVGIARLNPRYVYSHVGRGPEPWGEPITMIHKYVIPFSLEMAYDSVEAAPDIPITEETARQYLRAAEISIELARRIRALGYPARAHVSESNYQIMLPPVAQDAGLGELGRIGYLVSPKFGARIRLGAVTTDLPLMADKPGSFGLQDFCDKCVKCGTNCPSAAIPLSGPTIANGVNKWPLNIEQCIRYWRLIGTDCGLCMKVCPYSHPTTLVHSIVRAGIKRSAFARTVSVWGDDLFYGRK